MHCERHELIYLTDILRRMHNQPLHQSVRQGQGEAGDTKNQAVQGMRRRRLRREGVELEGHVPALHAVEEQHVTLGFPTLTTFSRPLYIPPRFLVFVVFCIAWCLASLLA